MKVFFFSTHTLWPHHAETELEIMQDHLNNGDEIFRFICKGELPVCDTNIDHRFHACLRCVDKQEFGQKILKGSERILTFPLVRQSHFELAAKHEFNYNDINVFKEVKIDNFDIGYAVCSSVISALREPAPGIIENLQMFRGYFYSSLAVYYSALEYVEEHKPDLIYAFNGRVAHAKPILRIAQKYGIECRIYERGCDIYHYGITVNTTPHDINYFFKQMQSKWEKADPVERERTGAIFYEERVQGKEQGWVSFVNEQKKDLLPENWNPSKHNIAFFNTSEDEYESIGPEWKNFLYPNQAYGIEKILKDFLSDEKYHFYLRIHPNLKGLNNKQIKDALELSRYKNLTIIDADSAVSTYTLMKNAEKVITFGSSTGIEAAYWGKVSILLGKSFYYNLDVAYKPNIHAEVIELISSPLQSKSKIDALKYGYYFKTFGEKFKYYKPTGFLSGTFMNYDLDKVAGFKTKMFEKLANVRFINSLYQVTKSGRYAIQKFILKW
jgi:hypothetical protein